MENKVGGNSYLECGDRFGEIKLLRVLTFSDPRGIKGYRGLVSLQAKYGKLIEEVMPGSRKEQLTLVRVEV